MTEGTGGSEPLAEGVDLPRVLRIVTALVWILWGLKLYSPTFYVSGAPEAGFSYTLLGVAALVLVCAPLPERWSRRIDLLLLTGTTVAIALWTRSAVYGSPAYGTDEAAYAQGAAQLLLQGRDPYGVDLRWALDAFRVLPSGITNTLDGGFIHTLTYPAGAFLVYVPLLAAGVQSQAAIYVDGLFWILGMVVLWLALPRPVRVIVPILASLGVYIDYATGGVTDSLMVPFLVGAFWRWDRFGDPNERGMSRWVGPLALGLACTIKQSAWFFVPPLAIGILIENVAARRGWRALARYVVLLSLGFCVPNLPFIFWNRQAWVAGVLQNFFGGLVPFGQGLIAASTYFFVGGGDLRAYAIAGAAIMLGLCLALAAWYRQLKPLVAVLPLIALLIPTRSLNSYFVYAVPGLIVTFATTRGAPLLPWARGHMRLWVPRLAASGATAFGCAALLLALATPAPIVLQPVAEHTTGQLQTVDSLTVDAENRSGAPLAPHFAVALGAYMSSYWIVHEGPAVMPAHSTAQYVLWAPNTPSMPGIAQESVLYALTADPPTISSAPLFAAIPESAQISPQAVNAVVEDPPELTLTVQVVDRLNAPIRRAGVGVALGQVIYAAEGLFPGEASINGRPEGQSPVTSVTDSDGVARFTVQAIQQQPYELFFQAWLPTPYPHGYSSIVAVRFGVSQSP